VNARHSTLGRAFRSLGGLAQGERSAAFRKIIKAAGLEMTPDHEPMESTRARGEDLKSQGCARHAPATQQIALPTKCYNIQG
jgi:hypothetical protein